jgi:hypothetical protein
VGIATMNENRLILILGLAGFVVMADNWVVSPNGGIRGGLQ